MLKQPIEEKNITLVFQGRWTEKVNSNIEIAKKVLPGATVLLSTFSDRQKKRLASADIVVYSNDPGQLPPYKYTADLPENNINRQIVTSREGLIRVTTDYAVKIRTDCTLQSRAFVNIYEKICSNSQMQNRLVVSSFYTLHPRGIEGFPFHVSDWFMFGPSRLLKEYWDVPLMSVEDAVWFDVHSHSKGSNYFARLYRAKYAPEQYVSVAYAKKLGYKTPRYLEDNSDELIEEYERFLGREFIIDSPESLGLIFPKYSHLIKSKYQNFNCVSLYDWAMFFEMHGRDDNKSLSPLYYIECRYLLEREEKRRLAVGLLRRLNIVLPLIKKMGLMSCLDKFLNRYC